VIDSGAMSRRVATSAASTLRRGASRATSAPGNTSVGSNGGDSRARTVVNHRVAGTCVANQASHRRIVRRGGDLGGGEVAATRHVPTTIVIARYTRRPRNTNDGGVSRFRQPSRAQHRLRRRRSASPASPTSPPRGLRG